MNYKTEGTRDSNLQRAAFTAPDEEEHRAQDWYPSP